MSTASDPGSTSASPQADTVENIVFGVLASVTALAALYLAYRQLRATRHASHEPRSARRGLLPLSSSDVHLASIQRSITLTSEELTVQWSDPR